MEQSGLPTDCPTSYWFRNISEEEATSTYLKEATASLSRVCADMEQHQVVCELAGQVDICILIFPVGRK